MWGNCCEAVSILVSYSHSYLPCNFSKDGHHLEDPPRYRKWLVTPMYKPFSPFREQPYLGDLLTMIFNHLLTGMILQVEFSEGATSKIRSVLYLEVRCEMGKTAGSLT